MPAYKLGLHQQGNVFQQIQCPSGSVNSTNNYVGSDVALFDRMLMRHDLKYTLAHINKNTGTGDNISSFQL